MLYEDTCVETLLILSWPPFASLTSTFVSCAAHKVRGVRELPLRKQGHHFYTMYLAICIHKVFTGDDDATLVRRNCRDKEEKKKKKK